MTALALLGGVAWAGHRWVTTSSRFAIADVVVRGTHQVGADELRAALPVRAGDNVFADLAGIARAARANPWIASAEVHRILPNTITVDVREYTAAAVVELGELYLVDGSGRPFKRTTVETGETDGLPILTGVGRASYLANRVAAAATVRLAIAASDRWRAGHRPAIREIHIDPHGAVALHTQAPAIAIQLGPLGADLDARIRAFDTAWAALGDDERSRTRAIHIGARPDHVTVAFATD